MQNKNFDFLGKKKIFLTLSGVLIAIVLLATAIFGVDLSINFKGGTILTYIYDGEISDTQFKADVEKIAKTTAIVTIGEDFATKSKTMNVSLASNEGLTADKQFELTNTLKEKYAENGLDLISSSDVKPTAGKEFFVKCMVAIGLAFLVTVIYIAFRFKAVSGWSAGVFAIIGLIHDVIIVFGAFVLFGFEINANFMAVVLTILGYSINDTIVVYDRIRENKKLAGKKGDIVEIVNRSLNECIHRTINTTITTVTAMICVSVVGSVYGITSILSFSTPLLFGMISGVYSTMFVVCPLWVLWQTRKNRKKRA